MRARGALENVPSNVRGARKQPYGKKSTKEAPAAGPLFFDASGTSKQEEGFTAWVNFAITSGQPADADAPAASDAAEGDSLREVEEKRADAHVHTKFVRLLSGAALRGTLESIEQYVDEGSISVREPLNLKGDIGLRDNLISLLCCYNPLWLARAADAIAGRPVTRGDVAALGDHPAPPCYVRRPA